MYYCWLSMTPLKTGQRNNFMKNGFQIRIQHPRISFGANFQNFLTILRFSWKLRPTFWGAGPRPKQHVPPVSHLSCWKVQISGDPILSLGCLTIPRGGGGTYIEDWRGCAAQKINHKIFGDWHACKWYPIRDRMFIKVYPFVDLIFPVRKNIPT